MFWVDRIYICIHSAFSSCISCLLAWTSCWVMYAHCAFARPVWSDFWRPCLISRMCVYFLYIFIGRRFQLDWCCNWFRRFYNSCKSRRRISMTLQFGEQERRGEGGRAGGEEIWGSRVYTWGNVDAPRPVWFLSFYRAKERERGMSAALLSLFHK